MRKLAVIAAVALFVVGATLAATSYTSTSANVNSGDPGWVNFNFGTMPGGTILVVQCAHGRAELITDAGVYGQQQASGFFPITCTGNITVENGFQVYHETLNNTPFTVTVQPQDLDLTLNSVTWQSTREGCGRSGSPCYRNGQGVAQIAY